MNLELKPIKCRSLSICAGKPTECDFFIENYCVPTVRSKPEKCLGTFITFSGKSSDTFNIICEKIVALFKNIDAACTVVCEKIAALHEKAHFWLFLVEISFRFGKALNCR